MGVQGWRDEGEGRGGLWYLKRRIYSRSLQLLKEVKLVFQPVKVCLFFFYCQKFQFLPALKETWWVFFF